MKCAVYNSMEKKQEEYTRILNLQALKFWCIVVLVK